MYISDFWNQKSCSQDYTRIELLPRRNCSRLKWKSCSIWNGIPDVLRRAISVAILFPNNSKLCSAREMHLPFVYLYASVFVLFVTGWNTFRHTPIYTKTKERWGGGSLWRAKTEFLLCSWTVPRRGILLAFVPVTFRDYLTQRRSNVFDNKFDDSILVVHFENSIFFNLIQILFAIKHFVNEKLLLLFLYWNLELEFY